MNVWSLLIIAVGLSMDAFASAICKGLSVQHLKTRQALTVGLYFGVFQALMPLLGYHLASLFSFWVEAVDHWLSFGLLLVIGVNMILESRKQAEGALALHSERAFSPRAMLPLAIATSVDALAAGIAFALGTMRDHIVGAVILIGVVTCLLSALGVKLGQLFGERYRSKAEMLGGILLIGMGTRILLCDLGVWP